MTRLAIAWVGPTKSEPLRALVADYLRRIRAWERCDLYEVKERPRRDARQGAAARAAEEAALREIVSGWDRWIALTPEGAPWTTGQWLRWWGRESASAGRAGFLLGGPEGLDPGFAAEADHQISLAPVTLSHELARVVFLEQLYRVMATARGVPYGR